MLHKVTEFLKVFVMIYTGFFTDSLNRDRNKLAIEQVQNYSLFVSISVIEENKCR